MKTLSLALALGIVFAAAAHAQSNVIPPRIGPQAAPPPTSVPGTFSTLSDVEKTEFMKAKDLAMQQDPSLGTDAKNLIEQEKAAKASGTDQIPQPLQQQMSDYKKRLDAAMIAVDPAVAPIIAKMKGLAPDQPVNSPTTPAAATSASTPLPVNAQSGQ